MKLSYRKVTADEVEPLHAIVWECGRDIAERFGMIHWLPPYSIEAMRESTVSRNVHAIYADSDIVGTFTTGTHGWKYDEHIWADRSHKAIYLGKLAIRPSLQGTGIGSWVLSQVEQQAHDLHCQTCLLYTSPSPRDRQKSRMPSSA